MWHGDEKLQSMIIGKSLRLMRSWFSCFQRVDTWPSQVLLQWRILTENAALRRKTTSWIEWCMLRINSYSILFTLTKLFCIVKERVFFIDIWCSRRKWGCWFWYALQCRPRQGKGDIPCGIALTRKLVTNKTKSKRIRVEVMMKLCKAWGASRKKFIFLYLLFAWVRWPSIEEQTKRKRPENTPITNITLYLYRYVALCHSVVPDS